MGPVIFLLACSTGAGRTQQKTLSQTTTFKKMNESPNSPQHQNNNRDTATFAAGCYWCVEALFQQLEGVEKVVSGFTDGHVPNPTYEAVCTGNTGHAEACNIIYNPSVLSFDELLAAFFTAHDPTQLNRQGNDVGSQYRSGIYYHNDEQKEKANYYIRELNKENVYPSPIVTEVKPFKEFYKAKDSHQDYYNQNKEQGYCRMVIQPKLEKFKKVFAQKIKP